jgi:hypothetical protein
VAAPVLLPAETFKDTAMPAVESGNHWHERVNACRGQGAASAGFDYSGPLTEFVLLGVVANRAPGKRLVWRGAEMKLEGSPEAAALLRRTYRKGWEVEGL